MSPLRVNWMEIKGDIGGLIAAYESLPKSIAKKHLVAAVKRSLVKARGVPTLKELTPPEGKAKRGRRKKYARRSTGMLKKAASVVARYKGTNRDGCAFGVLGYKYGLQSRKAIWMEHGTRRGIKPRHVTARALARVSGSARSQLCYELSFAFQKAVTEASTWRAKKAARMRGIR